MVRRGRKIVEPQRIADAKAHGGRKHCVVEKLRQAHTPSAPRTSTLPRALNNSRGDDGGSADTGEAARGSLQGA